MLFLSLTIMKKIVPLLVSLLILACGPAQTVATTPVENASKNEDIPQPAGPDGLKAKMPGEENELVSTSTETVGTMMAFLASDDLKGRDTGSEGIEKAAQYIEEHFQQYGIAPFYTTYRDTLSNFRKPAYNIVGQIVGNDPDLKDQYIIVGAHYDHIGIVKPENGDYIANGANDNASGTTTVLEIAKYFGQNRTNKRSLIFALFSAEEKGLLGSKHMAKNMKAAELNLYTMLNFEMVGVPLRSKKYSVYITGYQKSNLAAISNAYAGEDLVGFLPTAKNYGLFERSDNYPFYNEFKVPSHTYCTFDFTNFAYYHKPDDEVAQLDIAHMAKMINKLIPVVEGIANGPDREVKMAQ